MDEERFIQLMDGQVWLMNAIRWALAEAQDSLTECRTSMSGGPQLEPEQDRPESRTE